VEVAGYRLVEKFRVGSFSELHLTDGGLVMKLVVPHLGAIVDRWLADVERAAAIGHPGILFVEKTGKIDGVLASGFAVMPRLDGANLHEVLRSGPITADASLSLMRQMVGALGAAHRVGLRHGTVWPQHFFIGLDERVTLLDFGMGPAMHAYRTSHPTLTGSGGWMGPVGYMSPEECRGNTVDLRADLYALGCIFYELFAGRAPFSNPDLPVFETIKGHILDAPPPLPATAPLGPLTMAMLEKDPAKRPSCDEIAVELDRLYASSGR
jgi:serine/threonine protein kinase